MQNFRDISISDKIVKGRIFRSGELSSDIDHFLIVNKIYKIRTILDLRRDEQFRNMSSDTYSSILTTNDIKWINYPIGDNGQSENPEMELKNGSKTHNPFYEWLPRYGAYFIVDVLQFILREEWPILIHCSAGRDRTGIVVALIQDIMGIERQSIIQSYLVSEGSRIENISLFFKVLDDLGGPRHFLMENGFPQELITELIERLTLKWE